MGTAYQESLAKQQIAAQIWNSRNVERLVQKPVLIRVFQSHALCSVFQGVSAKKDLSLTTTKIAYPGNHAESLIVAQIWYSSTVEVLVQKIAPIKVSQELV